MTSSPDDEQLSREFSKQREEDARAAPPFVSMWRVRRPLSPLWLALPAVSAFAAAATVIWMAHATLAEPPKAADKAPIIVLDDPEPLAFLLDSPILEPMPGFDESAVLPR